MKKKSPFYTGNFPNSPNYDPNLPIGINKWDLEEAQTYWEAEEEFVDEQYEQENKSEWEKE